jgi:hypothetical protein
MGGGPSRKHIAVAGFLSLETGRHPEIVEVWESTTKAGVYFFGTLTTSIAKQ